MNIYIIEDYPVMHEILCDFVNALPDMHVCGSALQAQEGLSQLPNIGADIVVVDMSLPDMTGTDFVTSLRLSLPDLPCIIFSANTESIYIQEAFAVGAKGYICKFDFSEIEQAIKSVLAGKIYLSSGVRGSYVKPTHIP